MGETEFLNYLLTKGLSDETLKVYIHYYRKFVLIKEALGVTLTQDFANTFLSEYHNIVARAMLQNLLEHEGIHNVRIAKITGRKKKRHTILITPEHQEELRTYFYDKRIDLGLMFDLSSYGALRRAEVINIKPRDFNIREATLNKDAPASLRIIGKGDKERKVIIPRLLLKATLMYAQSMEKQMDDKLFDMGKTRWWQLFHKACLKLGYTYKDKKGKVCSLYHPHSIRHTTSSAWWEKGTDITRIQRRLGHSSVATTQLYLTPDEKKEELEWAKEYQ